MSTQDHLGGEHTSRAFDDDFTRLIDEIVRMGHLAADALARALAAFAQRDAAAAADVVAADRAVDALDQQVGHDVLRLLALRQPIARDLREIVAAQRTAAAIERIGDYAANIGKRVGALAQVPGSPLAERIAPLGVLAQSLLGDVLTAYRERDAERAHAVWQRDAELDRLHTLLFTDLLAHMQAHPEQIPACAQLMFIARNLERIGDHATNIAEQVWFIVRGEPLDEARAKQDRSSSVV